MLLGESLEPLVGDVELDPPVEPVPPVEPELPVELEPPVEPLPLEPVPVEVLGLPYAPVLVELGPVELPEPKLLVPEEVPPKLLVLL